MGVAEGASRGNNWVYLNLNIKSLGRSTNGHESLIWVGYHNLGQLLAPKRIELESPATSQIEDNFKAFLTVITSLSCGIKR